MGKQKIKRTSSQNLSPISGKMRNPVSTDPTRKSPQVTIMLLSVAFAFLLFTSPISIYMATIFDNITHVRKTQRELVKSILRYIAYFNNAINFYIYISLSSEFRREFFKSISACFKTKELVACTKSTDLPEFKENDKPLPRTKQIVRKPLAFKRYEDNSEEPFLERNSTRSGNSHDSVEIYKKKTRKAPLVHFNKNPRWSIPEKDEHIEDEYDFYNQQNNQTDTEDDYEYRENLDDNNRSFNNDYDYQYLAQGNDQDVPVVNYRPVPEASRKFFPRNQLSTIYERDSFSENSRQTFYTAQPIEILPVRYDKKTMQKDSSLTNSSLPVRYQQSLSEPENLNEYLQNHSEINQRPIKREIPTKNYHRSLPPRKEKISIESYATEV